MKGALTKHLNIIDYTLSSLWRRRSRNGSVLIVFAGVIFLVASFQFVTGALTETALDSLRSAPEITVQRLSAGRQTEVPLDYGGQIAGIHGVREVVPRIWGYYFDEVTGANLT
ncbi:MAG: ABC transporter permease, partial [Desulfobulbaceae bacterium]